MQYQDCAAIATAPQSVSAAICNAQIQQISRTLVQRMAATPTVTPTTALVLATFTPLLSSVTTTKIISIQSKYYSPSISGTEPVTIGSNDNSTPAGRSEIVGESVPGFTGMFSGVTPVQKLEIDKLFAEGRASADFDRLGVYLLCGDSQLIMHKDGGPIPIHSPFIGAPTGGELHVLTQARVQWEFAKDWYENAVILKLPFNHALLVNP